MWKYQLHMHVMLNLGIEPNYANISMDIVNIYSSMSLKRGKTPKDIRHDQSQHWRCELSKQLSVLYNKH
jgi:hypothetical protein